eukprot:197539-Prymnesium_polylepis.1
MMHSLVLTQRPGDTRRLVPMGHRAFRVPVSVEVANNEPCMNGSFNIRTRQGGSGRVGHGAINLVDEARRQGACRA